MAQPDALAPWLEQTMTSEGALPEGTVTFLLTDIEQSTRSWEQEPAAMSIAVARHYELLDAAITGHQGVRPVEQGEGDSVVGAFARASDAVAAALDAQRALLAEPWPDGAPLRVRMAVHTGEAELRDAGNYFGLAVIRCARLRAIAHGGQILVSTTTADLVVEHLPAGASLVDLGTQRLRDLGRAERVWQLSHADLPSGFEPLRSLNVLPNNLPMQLTSFVGREVERLDLRQLLPTTRLLSLTGAGGCGKTRLALQLAADALDDFDGGAWLVELAAVSDGDRVAATVASGLGERDLSGDLVEVIVGRLRERTTLLVLDNCEHLLEPVAELANTLLHRCPALTIVATTREPLGVPGETAWRVPSLSLPDRSEESAVDVPVRSDAVRLFVDRAAKVRPNFRLTAENGPAVVQICHRLDGIPLAIELAAARVRAMTVEQLADAINDRFRLLTGGARTVLPRQQTLQASVDWSYGLLSEPERAVFRRLAVFTGGFTLDAAERVVAGDGVDEVAVLDHLLALTDKSMIIADDVGRYRMLETLRQYGAARLVEAGETVPARDRHLGWAAGLCRQSGPPSTFAWVLARVPQLRDEVDNLRAAFEWAVDAADAETAQLIARDVLVWAVGGGGHLDDSIQLATRALALDGACADTNVVTTVWVLWAQHNAGTMHDKEQAEERLLRDLELVDDPAVRYHCLHLLGMTTISAPHRALALFSSADEAARRCQQPAIHQQAAIFLAMARAMVGDQREAVQLLEAASSNILEPPLRFQVNILLSAIACDTGRFDDARHYLDALERGTWNMALNARAAIAAYRFWLDLAQGRDQDSSSAAEALVAEARLRRYLRVVAIAGWTRGARALAHGDIDEAVEALRRWRDEAPVAVSGTASTLQVHALLAAGRLVDAHEALGAIRALPPRGLHDEQRVLHAEGLLARADGNLATAEQLHHRALAIQQAGSWRLGMAHTFEALAGLAARQGSHVEAARLAGAAQRVRDEIGYVLRWSFEQRLLDDDLALVHAALGDAAFGEAYEEGRLLDVDEAAAYASRARGERRRPRSGAGSLTPTEQRVARLAASGRTNQQIAADLLMGAETVKTHLARVYDKLDVRSRRELTALPTLGDPDDDDT